MAGSPSMWREPYSPQAHAPRAGGGGAFDRRGEKESPYSWARLGKEVGDDHRARSLRHWLAELRLVSSLLLLARLFKLYRLEQPALRIAMSIVVGLATLAVEVTAPGWPRN